MNIDGHVGAVIGGVFLFMMVAVILANADKLNAIISGFYASNTNLLKTGMGQ